MFDLNELPENEGPAGKASALYSFAAPAGGGRSGRRPAAAMARKAEEGDEDEDVVITVGRRVVEEEEEDEEEEQVDDEEEEYLEEQSQQVYYRSGDSTEIVRRLLRDQEAEQSFLRLNNPSTICYPSDWQPSELTTYDENDEIDTDNEVTVAALDARAILDSQVVSRLDSAVSLVLPTEPPAATFGISPRPEKLGQRTESSSGKYHSDFTNFHRHRKWDSVLPEKSDKFDDELNLASRSTLLYPGVVSSRKGKRAREEGSVTIDTILKLKRHARLPPAVVVADAYDGAGPSLSMSLDQCSPATAKNATFATAPHKISSKGEGSERREGTSLSFVESSLAGFESTMAVVQRALGHKYLGSKSNLGLSMSVGPKGQTTADRVESNVVDTVPSVRKDREGYECGAESLKKSGREVVLADAAGGIQQPSEKLVWQGKLVVHGSATEVAAYCSADLQPTSRLWCLPQVLTVENLVKIQEFFSAAKQANAIEPILRLRLLPDAASSGVTILNSKTRGRTKDQSPLPEMLGWHTGSHASRNGVPPSAAGSDYVFTVSPKFKQPGEAANGTSAKLYLVLGSSLDLVSTYDREVGKKLFRGVEGSSSPEENQLFGFLCISEAEGSCDDSIKTREAKTESSPAGVDISTTKEQVLVQGLPSNTIEVVADAFHNQGRERTDAVEAKMTCEDEAAVSSAEKDEEAAATDGNLPNIANDQKGHSSDNNHEKVKGKNESHSLRHNQSPTRDDVRKDRERQRDRDRDLRGREKEKDLSHSNKDVQRYLQHRSSDKVDFSKRDRSKDREGDRFRERSHRDSHRDLADRLKSSRERIKEHEKPKRDREKEKEKERPFKKRDLSPEPEMGATEDLELEKARSSAKQEDSHHHLLEQSIKENRKRIRVESVEKYENNLTVSEISTVQSETEETKLGKSGLDATTETVRDVLQDSRHAVGSGQVESIVQVTNTVMVESLGDAETDTPSETVMKKDEAVQVDHKDHDEKPVEVLPVLAKKIVTPSSSTNALLQDGADLATPPIIVAGLVNTVVAEGCDAIRVMDRGVNGVKEETQEEGLVGIGEFAILKDRDDTGIPQSKEHAMEVLGKDMNIGQAESGGQSMNDGNVKVFDKPGDAGSIERTVPEPSYNPKEERTSDTEMLDDVQRSNSKILSVRVDGNCYPVKGPKSEDSQDSLLPPRRFLKDNSAPSAQKSVTMGGDDQHGSLMGVDSPSSATENGVQASSPGLLDEVSSETLLESCDKETRSWLVSKQNACYLAEEFGVRIARIEEVFQAKSELQLKAQQGPFDLKVFLVTENSTDSNEGKWFMTQAADMLQTLSARGVFTKCLWYEGLVQRYASDQGPSIPAVVRRIKGEDGKNLEKIEEETGIMIGIVLDGKTRKGIGNFTRVIGLRLRGTRKKGIQEATKQAGVLLSQVAEQFSKGTRARSFESHDAALLKLKVDFSNNTSPSSGILTPMHKDVFAAYSPVSPVATISPLGSFKHKPEEISIEATHTAPPTAPTSVLPDSSDNVNPAPAAVSDFASQSQQSEDEQPDKLRRLSDLEAKYVRPLLVSNLPEGATTSMLRALFEDVLKEKFGLPPSYEGVSDMIADIRFSPDKLFAFVEFASDELLLEVLKIYADKKPAFFGLNLEMGSSASLNKLERMFLAARTESTGKGLEYGCSIIDSLKFSKSRTGRKGHKSDDHSMRVTSLRSSPESDVGVSRERRLGGRDGTGRYPREKPSPLFLTELMKNSSAGSIHTLFEDIIKKYRNPPLGHFKARAGVLDVRFIPSRGCAFVDLSSAELVDFVLDLHFRRPEVFHHMKMEIGRRPVPLGHGEEEPVHAVKRSNHLNRDAFVEESRGYGSGTRARGYFPSTSPPPTRRNVLAVMDHDVGDDYEEEEEDEKQPMSARKRRSDPERTVYADRLPENASEGMIRRIFERVLRDNMTDEQRELLGDNIITEVRYVPTKFCAFIVLVAEELTRLVLQLYNQDEEIFKNMRLKPHFHSRMEDLYREDLHDRDDAPVHRVLSRDRSTDRRSRRGMDDYHNGYPNNETGDLVHRSRHSAAHRAVAATAFKEVDRRRSVYVDRIPERLPEPKVRELFERAMRQHRHAYRSHTVSQVTFFRDKFDPEKLCAFVELEHEDMVQELLDIYSEDEEAFTGMRVRPAIKYGH